MNSQRTGFVLITLALVATLFPACESTGQGPGNQHVIRMGQEDAVLSVFNPRDGTAPFSPFVVQGVAIHQTQVDITFAAPDGSTVSIQLVHPSADSSAQLRTRDFALRFEGGNERALALATKALERLQARPLADFWIVAERQPLPSFVNVDVSEIEDEARMVIDRPMILTWLFLGFLLGWLGLRSRPAPRWGLALAGLFGASFLLRLVVGSPGPGNPSIIFSQYGHAPVALLSLWDMLWGLSPDSIILTARVLGAAAPVFLALFVHEQKADRRMALAAGVLLAIQPLLVRFSSDCERQSYVLFLGAVSLWGLARYLNTRSVVALVLHATATVLCIESRPEAFVIVPMSALLVWPGRPWKRAAVPALLALVALGAFAFFRFPSVGAGSQVVFGWSFQRLFFDADFTSLVVQGLFMAGLLIGFWRLDRTVVWAVVGLLMVQVVAMGRIPDGPDLYEARFRTLGFLPFSFVASSGLLGLVDLIGRRRLKVAAMVIAWVAIGLSSVRPFQKIVTPRTLDLEFQYLVRTIPRLPPGAEVYFPSSSMDMEFRSFTVVAQLVSRGDLMWRQWPPDEPGANRPSFFYLHSMCNAAVDVPDEQVWETSPHSQSELRMMEGFQRMCTEAMGYATGAPLFEETLPIRKFGIEAYRGRTSQVGFVPIRLPADFFETDSLIGPHPATP